MSEEEFLKYTTLTPKNYTLKVLKRTERKSGGRFLYEVYCEHCSNDQELHPEILITKNNLIKGAIPCSCSSPRYSKKQYLILLSRYCNSYNFTYNLQDIVIKSTSKVFLFCKEHQYRWSTDVSTILKGKTSCKLCNNSELKRKNLQELEYDLKKDGILNPEDFLTRNLEKVDSKGQKSYLNLHCATCEKDTYSKLVGCPVIFPTLPYSLRCGHKPCRCSPNYCWTDVERLHQVKIACVNFGGKFVKTLETGMHSYSKIVCECSQQHLFTKTINELINNNSWCKRCAIDNNYYGFYPDRSGEVDFLYLIDFSTTIKVGRSFTPKLRLSQLESASKLKGSFIKIYTGTHTEVYNSEQEILSFIKQIGAQEIFNWTRETYSVTFNREVLEFSEKLISKVGLQEVL